MDRLERDFYSIVPDGDGNKRIHAHEYCYLGDDGDKSYSTLPYSEITEDSPCGHHMG